MEKKGAIKHARMNFMFAAIQYVSMKNNIFTYQNLPKEASWNIGNKTLIVKWEGRSDGGFKKLVENQMRSALGIWAITSDTILREMYDNEPYQDDDEERKAIRCIIYMLRCAYAHNPIEPKWNVTSDNYEGVFEVPSIGFSLSTVDLNGKILEEDSIDWFGAISLMQYCETFLD